MSTPAKKTPPSSLSGYILAVLFLCALLPLGLTIAGQIFTFKSLLLFYLFNAISAGAQLNRHLSKIYDLDYKAQGIQEKINILDNEGLIQKRNNASLKSKISRYQSLKKVTEDINQNLELNSVADTLCSMAFSLISDSKGSCLLYLVNHQTHKVELFKAKKEDPGLVIKAKEGDVFDYWVLRHSTALLIEDIKQDFRFDPEKLNSIDSRAISSLISAPFITENKFLGILRLDSALPRSYSQDLLRFLATICDLGGVALENSELFQRTQDLAIHDGLTSLYTKGHFLERLEQACSRGARQKDIFSLLMLDIDFFKNYNDQFGHTAGDLVLKNLSRIITDYFFGEQVVISRFGGEEFCIILEKIDKKNAVRLATGLRDKIEKERLVLRRSETSVTVSIGVASFLHDAVSKDELIQKADRAMYTAKQKGRNRVCSL